MRIPRHWTRGRVQLADAQGRMHEFEAWGWSNDSLAEAERKGQERATNVGRRILEGDRPDRRYGYGAAPLREEIGREYCDGAGRVHSIITTNSYGCQVLNTTQLMFVDVDLPVIRARENVLYRLRRLVGMAAESPRQRHEAKLLANLDELLQANDRGCIRIYRTKAGLRYVLCDQVPLPESDEAARLMDALGADPLYQRLCKAQECYRARLTPKPWRCGLRTQRVNYPWPDPEARRAFVRWQQEYKTVAARYATCELLREVGPRPSGGPAAEMLDLHDSMTRATSGLPLA